MVPGILVIIVAGALCTVLNVWVLFRPQNKTIVIAAACSALLLALTCAAWLWLMAALANGGL